MREGETDRSKIPWAQYAEAERRSFLKQFLERERGSESKENWEGSLLHRLLDEITADAVSKLSEAYPRNDREFEDRLYEAARPIIGLRDAATSHEREWDKRERLNFWRHARRPEHDIKNKTYKLNFAPDVEFVASSYLNQPLRSKLFDRTLVDMLIAVELFKFADEMLYPFELLPGDPRPPLKQPHPLWLFIKDNVISTAVLGGVAWVTGAAMAYHKIGDWGGWVIGGCLLLWIIGAAWSVIALPIIWRRWAKGRKRVLELLNRMLSTYAEMQSDSVISASRVLDSVNASAAIGVVWPSPLYVVLEDVIARGGRL